jgi:phosphatidylethanolamine/phosphatidyl-N-methylethanolamine N-methyltransferase
MAGGTMNLAAKRATVRATMSDWLTFLTRSVARPFRVGAIAPSSRGLARAMAAQADSRQAGSVLELGPGTGVVTRALIDRGFAPERIVAIEYDPALASLMRARFSGVHVIQGDAFDLERSLGTRDPFVAVVSSLPLLYFPLARREALIATVFARLAPAAPFIQFTYGFRASVRPPAGATAIRAAVVLLNLPPAQVWVYRNPG